VCPKNTATPFRTCSTLTPRRPAKCRGDPSRLWSRSILTACTFERAMSTIGGIPRSRQFSHSWDRVQYTVRVLTTAQSRSQGTTRTDVQSGMHEFHWCATVKHSYKCCSSTSTPPAELLLRRPICRQLFPKQRHSRRHPRLRLEHVRDTVGLTSGCGVASRLIREATITYLDLLP
jgi:hypothetical protein